MSARSGRNIPRAARAACAQVLAQSDLCHLCGHHGARTCDHIIPAALWPKGADGKPLPGLDAPANLAPAHGTIGNTGRVNRCPDCGRLCNQERGAKPLTDIQQRRPW